MIRRLAVTASVPVVAAALLVTPAAPTTAAATDGWPGIFDPLVLRTLNLDLDPADWDTIRHDTTDSIEVPATFWADGEDGIQVSVRRKSSRALPSESNPVKVGLKVDINEFVDGQTWHGLTKVSLENGADAGVVEEGVAWNMHRFASGPEGYGYEAGFASWVRVNVNGAYIGLYVSAEQRDDQALRQRDLWVDDETWLYEQDAGGVILEEGDPDSPAVGHLCYSPFRPKGKGACATPADAALEADLRAWIDMDGFLTRCALDALTDNPDALCSHGKNTFFVDVSEARMASGQRRLYLPWDLDTVFHDPTSNIYALRSGRRVAQEPYERVILNHGVFRSEYNARILGLTDPTTGPLSETALHGFLDQVQPLLAEAIAEDPYPPSEGVGADVGGLKAWLTQRLASARSQAVANTNPAPRP